MGKKPLGLLNWEPEREQSFQRDMQFAPGYSDWRRGFQRKTGQAPNLDDPMYDYRAAWAAGVKPTPYEHDQGQMHWPSSVHQPPRAEPTPLKSKDHPTAWMETFMRQYGVDPHSASESQLMDAYSRGILRFP